MSTTAIKVEGLSKLYRIGTRRLGQRSFRETVTEVATALFTGRSSRNGSPLKPLGESVGQSDTLWALKDVSFEVQPGEVVGIIGRNGAGKSTLLKILSRITEPTAGYVETNGRVASLLEVGTGFHHELTGRENVYLNGAILGMKRAEINKKFDEIVAFAEVEKFIDTPVKHYSSGMYVRLAFAVAAHLEPDILILDEVLAVGDGHFQDKCVSKIKQTVKTGKTVLFVSHNMAAVNYLSRIGVLLECGRVKHQGEIGDVVQTYLDSIAASSGGRFVRASNDDNTPVFIERVELFDAHEAKQKFVLLEPICVKIRYRCQAPRKSIFLAIQIRSSTGQPIFTSASTDTALLPDQGFVNCRAPMGAAQLVIPAETLNVGIYELRVAACGEGGAVLDLVTDLHFEVIDAPSWVTRAFTTPREGNVLCRIPWELEEG